MLSLVMTISEGKSAISAALNGPVTILKFPHGIGMIWFENTSMQFHVSGTEEQLRTSLSVIGRLLL
jgi:hypothetical protein